jgi:hypothetical protein
MNITSCRLRVLCPGINSVFNRYEYQACLVEGKGGRCMGLSTLPHSYADCLDILNASTPWSRKDFSRPV